MTFKVKVHVMKNCIFIIIAFIILFYKNQYINECARNSLKATLEEVRQLRERRKGLLNAELWEDKMMVNSRHYFESVTNH